MSIIAEGTGENIGSGIAAQKIANNIEQIAKNADRVKSLNEKINEITKIDPKEAATFQKSIEPYLNSEKIFDVESLRSRKNIEQIEEFRKYTNNFTNLEKLKPEEILYLNLCDWLEPQARKINEQLKLSGGLKIIDPVSKAEVLIEEFDLFHSLLGEMKPGSIRDTTKGGHLFITELRAASLDFGEIKSFGNGFFDAKIKPLDSIRDFKSNSYFPKGTSIENAIAIIEDVIKNPKSIEIADNIKNNALKGFQSTNQENQAFMLLIKDKTLQFYPFKL